MAPSIVWSWFKKVEVEKVECVICKKKLKYCKSTSSLLTHLQRIHPFHPWKDSVENVSLSVPHPEAPEVSTYVPIDRDIILLR